MLPFISNIHEQLISPDHKLLSYSGRIDFSDPGAPCFIYAGSQLQFRFRGTALKLILRNHHHCWNNYIGYLIDGVQSKIQLELDQETHVYILSDCLDDTEHDVIIFKRQDAAHYFDFYGLILNNSSNLLPALIKPVRRIECFGDSVSAGEVSEAIDYVGKSDPKHNGELSNAWYSYAAITARRLNAELHNISQGGIALLNGTGYFHAPDTIGLAYTFDKLRYQTYLGPASSWDFTLYTPHVVLVAIGQNDAHPDNYMGVDKAKSLLWKAHYKALITALRNYYPDSLIILKTTILCHSKQWDEAIEMITKELDDPKIVHFLYSNNGCGTPGHIRIPEAEQMATELVAFIESFGEELWN